MREWIDLFFPRSLKTQEGIIPIQLFQTHPSVLQVNHFSLSAGNLDTREHSGHPQRKVRLFSLPHGIFQLTFGLHEFLRPVAVQ